MARKLEGDYYKRLLVLLLLVFLVLFLGGVAEARHRQIQWLELHANAIAILIIKLLPAALLNSLPALVALAAIPWLASRFIRTLYDCRDLREAHDFLRRKVFGMKKLQPILIVREGRIAVGAGSLYDRIGGRGFIVVDNDSAVVLEKGGRLTRVVGGPSLSFLERFERIWEVIDLRPQRWPLTVDAMTKEGIPVACQADITFKIDDRFVDRRGNERKKLPIEASSRPLTDTALEEALLEEALKETGIATPFPYTTEAVFNAATSIRVRIRQQDHKEQLRRWTGQVVFGAVEGTLRSILAEYRLDQLMQPLQPEHKYPREQIREKLEQKLRGAFPVGNEVGACIVDVDLGQIDVKSEEISTQWIKAWQGGWDQRAVESRAEGEAEMARLQAAQVQAQAEMALAFIEAIRPFATDVEEFPPYLLAMRLVETLRWMAYDPWRRVFLPPEILRTLDELGKMVDRENVHPDETHSQIRRLLEDM